MALTIDWVAIDCADPLALAAFWAEALGYTVVPTDDPAEVYAMPAEGWKPRLLFLRVPEGKAIKNRLHLDLRPDDRDAEVDRLVRLGARTVDVGQGDVSWVVLADPEGNELCVLRPLTDDEKADRAARGLPG